MELTDREWRSFDFVDVFEIHGGYYNKKPEMTEKLFQSLKQRFFKASMMLQNL